MPHTHTHIKTSYIIQMKKFNMFENSTLLVNLWLEIKLLYLYFNCQISQTEDHVFGSLNTSIFDYNYVIIIFESIVYEL